MTIVVDIGCAPRNGEESIPQLIERFQPTEFYGFDPDPTMKEEHWFVGRISIQLSRQAAWVYDGFIGYQESGIGGLRSYVGEAVGPAAVLCFDLAAFLHSLAEPVIMKMDCEGAEYDLVSHLTREAAWEQVGLLLIEWHKPEGGVLEIEGNITPIHVPVPWEIWG